MSTFLFLALGSAYGSTLSTGVANSSNHNGVMFDIKATNSVEIQAFTLYSASSGTCAYEVYYSTSLLTTAKSASSYWTKVGTLTSNAVTNTTAVSVSLSTPIVMTAGTTYAWYITSATAACNIYDQTGSNVGSVWASNGDLTLYEGYSASYAFSSLNGPRDWYGSVTYSAVQTWYQDADGDGYGNASKSTTGSTQPSGYVADKTDCDDTNSKVNPAAKEVCDASNTDEDCDGKADDNDSSASGQSSYYKDADADGYGSTTATLSCDAPTGYITSNSDCNDNNASINPAAKEVCDAANTDEDCDGKADDNDSSVSGIATYYKDADGDGYGSTTSQTLCDPSAGYVSTSSDCNDNSASISPGAKEICDAADVDEDCDGKADDNDSSVSNQKTWYLDSDLDGYGTGTGKTACDQPTNYATANGDCNDNSSVVSPGAKEICDSIDNDCDGSIDESSAVGAPGWHPDTDKDGYGSSLSTTYSCSQPSGLIADATDCDDGDSSVHPGANEYCDGTDTDCNGVLDDDSSVDALLWYVDSDGDGAGNASSTVYGCSAPKGSVANDTDCDDKNAKVFPGAAETCDNLDNDCDGTIDESTALNAKTWYLDRDGDGYGDATTATAACNQPGGTIATGGDCDDADATISPAALERCDGIDNNCDGNVDDALATNPSRWYEDLDLDGYGTDKSIYACNQPSGYAAVNGDCNDRAASANPVAKEVCNDADDDCDGSVDDAAEDAVTLYLDADKDGYGDPDHTLIRCDQPAGYITVGGDCDDNNGAYHPSAPEDCADPRDYNCDGFVGSTDNDGDGLAACDDCDDGHAEVQPGATEVCDGFDDNCDGRTDDSTAVDISTWFEDQDGDGYGVSSHSIRSCERPSGYVTELGDCDDASSTAYPGAPEKCEELVDSNCDGEMGMGDYDGDGFIACEECNDRNASVNADAAEHCNGFDDNCDGKIDEATLDGGSAYYADVDGDGYGSSEDVVYTCEAPDGYSSLSGDCNDADPDFYPGAPESCDTPEDYNCDGSVTDQDVDGDGAMACEDCNDGDASIFPGAEEVCDRVDNDCDGLLDEGLGGESDWYADADGDGFGDDNEQTSDCEQPLGYVDNNNDCDDSNISISPDAAEDCNNDIDDNCDGLLNESCEPTDKSIGIFPCGCASGPSGEIGLAGMLLAGMVARRRR